MAVLIREGSPREVSNTLTVAVGVIALLREQCDAPDDVTALADRAVWRILNLAQRIDWVPFSLSGDGLGRNGTEKDVHE